MNIFKAILSKKAEDDLKKVPDYITFKLRTWVDAVEKDGLRETRKLAGYHDEPLKGKRKGQHSIRLNKAYRAIYLIDETGRIHFIEILEVNKHDY